MQKVLPKQLIGTRTMVGFRLKDNIRTTDVVALGYIVITAIFILIFEGLSRSFAVAMVWRLIFILIAFVAIYLEYNYKSRFALFFHLFYPVLFLSFFYGETASINNYIFSENLDPVFFGLDHSLFGFQPSIEFSISFPQLWLSEILNFGYFSLYLMTFGVCLAFFFSRIEIAERSIFIIISSFLIYYLIFIVVPVVGPQYYLDYPINKAIDSGLFSRAVKLVQFYGEEPTGAFPSSHVGLVLIFLYLSHKNINWLFLIILPLFLLIAFATVYIKAHYAVDVIAGLLSAPIIYYISTILYGMIEKRLSYFLR